MKITTYQQLDELVAKELGWLYHIDSEDYYEGEGIMLPQNEGWVPPEYTNKINYCFNNLKDKERVPYYSTKLNDNQTLVNHIHSLDLELSTYSNKLNCWTSILELNFDREVIKEWDSTCGKETAHTGDTIIDSPINYVLLAICLAFLKYKSIEVELEGELV
jgi:hypothetical protein